MGIEALLKALPVSGIESETIAFLAGLAPKGPDDVVEPSIHFLEPPAGIRVPYVNPVEAIAVLLRHEGMSAEEAMRKAEQAYSELRSELALLERPPLYAFCDEIRRVPECLPVPRLVDYLRRERLVPEALCAFLNQACWVTGRVRIFTGPDNWNRPLCLSELPEVPPPKAMIEFFVGLPSDLVWAHSPDGNQFPRELLKQWRDGVRPVIAKLESALGRKLYHFADPEIDYDDDNCHRFLALHCWCSLVPDSNFVTYLLEVTGIENVETLKAALVSPASYRHAFDMNDAFVGIEPWPACRFEYLGDKRRRVGVVFQSREAQLRAEEVSLQQIGADILFLAPGELATQDWAEQATQFGHSWETWHDFTKPVSFLAQLDELHVVSDEDLPGQGWRLCVSTEVEMLMWRAHKDGVPLRFHSPNNAGLSNPEVCTEKHDTAAAVARKDSEREAFTDRLGIVRLSPDYGSSGLWNDRGQHLSYDSLDLPLAVVRRVGAWQRDYDDTLIPILPETADDAWWERHSQEELAIASELQQVLGDRVIVQVFEGGAWKPEGPNRRRGE